MLARPVTNISFGKGNSFLQKSLNAANKDMEAYYRSLHHEAKARLNYKKFQEIGKNISNPEDIKNFKDAWTFVKQFSQLAKRKIYSIIEQSCAYNECPERFLEPDITQLTTPFRFYKIK